MTRVVSPAVLSICALANGLHTRKPVRVAAATTDQCKARRRLNNFIKVPLLIALTRAPIYVISDFLAHYVAAQRRLSLKFPSSPRDRQTERQDTEERPQYMACLIPES